MRLVFIASFLIGCNLDEIFHEAEKFAAIQQPMVLTRAQAAAQASEHAQEAASDISSAIVELPSDNAVLVASAPALETVPGGVDYLAKIAEYFLAQTQALAAEHVALLTQQQGQNNAHSAALTTAQATTESRVQQLSDQQLVIVERLGEELTTTQAGLQEQFQSLRLMQDERGLQIERAVNDRLSHALKEMENELNESRLRIASQSDGVDHRFGTIEAKINGVLEAVMTRVNSLVEEKIDLLSKHQSSDEGTTHLMQKLVESSSVEVSANINQSLQIALQESHNEQKQEWMQAISTVEEHLRESVQCFVVEAASNIERQLESRVQKAITIAQSELNLQMRRQADATATLREKFRKQNAHAKEPPPTIDEDAIKATAKATVRDELSQHISILLREHVQRPSPSEQGALAHDRGDAENSNDIESSLRLAVKTICDVIKAETNLLKQNLKDCQDRAVVTQTATNYSDEDDVSDEDYMSDGDHEFEMGMQAAWRRTYGATEVPENSTQTGRSVAEGIEIEDKTEEQISRSDSGSVADVGRSEPQQTAQNQPCATQLPHCSHHQTQTQNLDLRILISGIQQEVADRAEKAALRYSPRQ